MPQRRRKTASPDVQAAVLAEYDPTVVSTRGTPVDWPACTCGKCQEGGRQDA